MPLSNKSHLILILIMLISFEMLVGCGAPRRPENDEEEKREQEKQAPQQQKVEVPAMPEALQTKEGKEPSLKVYIHDEGTVREMPFEEYVAGVVGGEIKNDWPEEVIKAQAIIARTFVMQFIDEKGHSRYEGAHVSTDIEEAQAWNDEEVNDRIKKAVQETRGQVMVYKGGFARAWFHSNAGGKTATADEGLNFKEGNPPYIQVVDSPDSSQEIPEDERNWVAEFDRGKVIAALQEAGTPMENFTNVSIGDKGPSGRALNVVFDDKKVSAPELRIALGSKEMKSTLLDEVAVDGDKLVFKGRGYGHGVGMSQWGGYSMAQNGKTAEDIIMHYFRGIDIVKMWK